MNLYPSTDVSGGEKKSTDLLLPPMRFVQGRVLYSALSGRLLPIPFLDPIQSLLLSCCIFLHDEPLGRAAEVALPLPLGGGVSDSSSFRRAWDFYYAALSSIIYPLP